MRSFLRVGFLVLSVWLCGCSDRTADDRVEGSASSKRVARTGGSAVALSRDERIAVVTNRSAGVVTVFSLAPRNGPDKRMITSKVELDTGPGSEPWSAVIGVDDDTAYVVLRESQTVARITSLRAQPVLEAARVAVGSEPSAIAISPSGQKLFVANWGEGTVSMILTPGFSAAAATIDLNQSLVDTKVLGAIASRPALAHPRALAITDDGDEDDDDETLYATEFFSQPLPGVTPEKDLSHVDRDRQGFVYVASLKTGQTAPAIAIAPVVETGFVDGEDRMTSCFPNQLYATAVDRERLYVTSMCTSPRGPLGPRTAAGEPTAQNFKTLFHPAVFVIDTATNLERPEQGRLLTRELARYYDEGGENDADARMPLIPNDIALVDSGADGAKAYVTALGADAMFRLDYDEAGALQGIGSPGHRAIFDLHTANSLPVGVAVSKASSEPFALVANDALQRLWIVDLRTESVEWVAAAPDLERAKEVFESEGNRGRRFFATGLDVWSFKGQAWSSCEGCHPGGLSDGVTWYFARGPRRTISTAGTYEKSSMPSERSRRLMLWGANIDEVHDVEGIVRSVSGGAGAVLWAYANKPNNDCRLIYDGNPPAAGNTQPCLAQKATTSLRNGLNGSLAEIITAVNCEPDAPTCDSSGASDWNAIDVFIRALRAPRGPTGLRPDDVEAGRNLFLAGRCAGCHGGPGWTLSRVFYEPGPAQNGTLPFEKPKSGSLDLGALREQRYEVPQALWKLNPAASAGGTATYRSFAPVDSTEASIIEYAYTAANQANEQIQCALRDVGTFPVQAPEMEANVAGVVPAGAPGVLEYRQDMKSLAQGKAGFSVPSLYGLSVGAPFFHAGNARTLEEAFDDETFTRHHQALATGFLDNPVLKSNELAQLVAFLLSIEESTELVPIPEISETGEPLEHDFCRP